MSTSSLVITIPQYAHRTSSISPTNCATAWTRCLPTLDPSGHPGSPQVQLALTIVRGGRRSEEAWAPASIWPRPSGSTGNPRPPFRARSRCGTTSARRAASAARGMVLGPTAHCSATVVTAQEVGAYSGPGGACNARGVTLRQNAQTLRCCVSRLTGALSRLSFVTGSYEGSAHFSDLSGLVLAPSVQGRRKYGLAEGRVAASPR